MTDKVEWLRKKKWNVWHPYEHAYPAVWAALFVAGLFAVYVFNKPTVSCEAQHPKDPAACSHLETWSHPAPSQPNLEYNRTSRWKFNDGI